MQMPLNARRLWLALGPLLLLIGWAYWPGLSGPFLFDDFGNLDALGGYGRIRDLPTLLFYLSSGTADPLGRPVALLSFLIDARNWPAEPWPFKRTNVLLHLVNTGLLAWLLARLQAALQRMRPARPTSPLTPLLAAGFWGAHPFFVSTTLYVVQREAMLPLTFILLGLLSWERAVVHFSGNRYRTGWLWILLGFCISTALAALSKANGLLAPLLAGLCYLWWWRSTTPYAGRRQLDIAALLLLGVPSLLLLAYLVFVAWNLWPLPVVYGRDWSLPERLLSEPRALWTYLGNLVLPRAGGGGVFVDDFRISRGWLEPTTTAWAIIALIIASGAAIVWRRKVPILGFAFLFFLAAQLLESTTVPLELYFEHRTYVPAVMLGWPLAHVLSAPGSYRKYRTILGLLLLAALLLLTHQRAQVWGNSELLGALAVEHKADSPRAQASAARDEVERGDVDAGLARIHAAWEKDPSSVDLAITVIGLECNGLGTLRSAALQNAQMTLASTANWNYGLYLWLQAAAVDPNMRRCRGFGLEGLESLVAAAERNPQSRLASRRRDLWHARGRIAIARGEPQVALRWFNAALLALPDPDYALVQAAALGEAGAPALGAIHLDTYLHHEARRPAQPIRDMASVHRWLLRHYGYYEQSISSLRAQLVRDSQAGGKSK